MNNNWEITTFRDVLTSFRGGSSFLKKEYVETGDPVITKGDVKQYGRLEFSDNKFIDPEYVKEKGFPYTEDGNLIVATRDLSVAADFLGLVAAVPEGKRYLVNQGANIFTVDTEKIRVEYFVYWTNSNKYRSYIKGAAVGSTQVHLRKDDFYNAPLLLPPLEEQDKIIDMLLPIDHKIELNRQTNQTLEHIAQAIFKSWFVDFEPTRAKAQVRASIAQGKLPRSDQNLPKGFTKEDEDRLVERAAMAAISGLSITDAAGDVQGCTNVASAGSTGATSPLGELDQLSPEQQEQLQTTAALFPDALVDSELGEIPKDWEVKPLSKMVELIGGGTPKKSEAHYWGGEIPWFSVKDAPTKGAVFVIDTELKITALGLNKSSTKLLPEGTTIISARGTVGKLAVVGVPTAMNQSCYGVKGVTGIGPYLNYFNVKEAVSTLQQNTHGAVFDTITRDTFDTVFQVDADSDVKQEFERTVNSLFEKIKNNLYENKALSELRDTLLPKLLSGELTIKTETPPEKAPC